MARRSSGGGLWLIFGALVLIVIVPKEIWIAIGVSALFGAAIYVIVKWQSKQHANRQQRPTSPPTQDGPTLAELLQASKPKPTRRRTTKLTSGFKELNTTLRTSSQQRSDRTETSRYGDGPEADKQLVSQPADWIAKRDSIIRSHRQRAEELRRKFPPGAIPPTDAQVPIETIHDGAGISSTSTDIGSEPAALAPDLKQQPDPLCARLGSQSEDWRKQRDALIQASRQKAEHLRKKFPSGGTCPFDLAGDSTSFRSKSGSESDSKEPRSGRALAEHNPTPANLVDLSNLDTRHSIERSDNATIAQANRPETKDSGHTAQQQSDREEFYSSVVPASWRTPERTFSVPKPLDGFGDARWVSPGETVNISGLNLPGGMLYVGARLKAANGSAEPSLISGQLNVARHGDFREHHTNYWPSYADISAGGRRAYLSWLAEGRSHPDCDIGLVFLFFYGLERRIILDTANDGSVKADWPAIADELRRLLAIYGDRSGSFRRYAGELLNWMELDGVSSKLYLEQVPSFPHVYELPAYLRLALGQSAVDRAPVPAQLALAWVSLNPGTYLRTAATRCPEEFERLFVQRYHEILGPGLVLPKNRTKLKFVYQAASAGFHGSTISLSFGDIPDATALTAPIRTLLEIANQCTDELGTFSRLVGKDPAARTSLEGLIQLPATLWPPEAQARLEALKGAMDKGMLTRQLDEVVVALGGASQPFNRDKVRALARALEAMEMGMEPDVLAGARTPNASDPVVLFALLPGETTVPDKGAYQTAALTLQLASAVAQADGAVSDGEVAHLRQEIEHWNHLTPRSRQRLHAHLSLLVAAPMTLASLKKKLDPLALQAKETVAAFMATLAQSDGVVSPDEVKFLEKVYKALGVEPKRVFSDIHSVVSGDRARSRTAPAGFRLDADRIAALEKDTARVSALLSEIFTEEEVLPPPTQSVDAEPMEEAGLLGLDEAHTALVRLMLSRPQWSRAELGDASADLELMLDGALEQVNEASFDTYDLPLSEGEDPIDINAEVVEKIEQ